MHDFLALKRTVLFKQEGVPIFVRLFKKHDADVALIIPNAKKGWTPAFFKTYSCCLIEGFISTHFVFCGGRDFGLEVKL